MGLESPVVQVHLSPLLCQVPLLGQLSQMDQSDPVSQVRLEFLKVPVPLLFLGNQGFPVLPLLHVHPVVQIVLSHHLFLVDLLGLQIQWHQFLQLDLVTLSHLLTLANQVAPVAPLALVHLVLLAGLMDLVNLKVQDFPILLVNLVLLVLPCFLVSLVNPLVLLNQMVQ